MASIGCSCLTNELIDARGLRCPLPVLRMEKRLEAMLPGSTLTLLTTDPVARLDVPLYCRQHGHACTHEGEGDERRFTIVKGGAA
jgi:tRNA 2-thiouridine synthesizing protein A